MSNKARFPETSLAYRWKAFAWIVVVTINTTVYFLLNLFGLSAIIQDLNKT